MLFFCQGKLIDRVLDFMGYKFYCNIGYSNHIQYLRLQGLNYLELQIDSDFIPDIYETLNCLISLSLIIFESIHVQL